MSKTWITRNPSIILGLCVVVGVASGMVVAIQYLLDKPAKPQKFIQQISLIQPPPQQIQKPPEPQIEEVEVTEPENSPEEIPEDTALDDVPPIGDDLGLDAEGGAGSDGFGLLGKKGGRGLLDGGGAGREFSWYTSTLQDDIMDFLTDVDEVRTQQYSIVVKLWIDNDGTIKQYQMVKSSGKPKIDSAIKIAFSEQPKFSEKPPNKMPQPIKLRITSKI